MSRKMIDQFVNFVIRPPRAEYNPDEYLWESEFTLAGRKYKRLDLELTNERGHTLQCCHYTPFTIPENTALPCVVYCHGNSGCRADANEAAVVLLPSNITVFTLDFSGSGLSGGDYVSLGWHEKDDLKAVVSYLRNNRQVSCIGLWGRSMGAVTSLLYGAEDPSIAGMVLDSAFSNLFNLMLELVDVYKIRLPKFTIKMALQYMRRIIQKKAKFDIMELNVKQFAPKTFIPALFGHASEDIFVPSHHSDQIYNVYAGDKNIVKFDGDHNSPRPQFYYDSVSIFFYNVLRPPQIPSAHSNMLEKYYDLGGLQIEAGADESLLYEIITGLRTAGSDTACSSSAPTGIPSSTCPNAKSVAEMLSESVAHMSISDLDFLVDGNKKLSEMGGSNCEEFHVQDTANGQNVECCSFSSSNRESWGRCSSIGADSDRSSSVDCVTVDNPNSKNQMTLGALAAPLRQVQKKSWSRAKENKKKGITISKKPKNEKMEKWESISQRLRSCFLRSYHR